MQALALLHDDEYATDSHGEDIESLAMLSDLLHDFLGT